MAKKKAGKKKSAKPTKTAKTTKKASAKRRKPRPSLGTAQPINGVLGMFLVLLAVDPNTRTQFESDPEAAMAANNLSEADKNAIRSHNPATVSQALGINNQFSGGRG